MAAMAMALRAGTGKNVAELAALDAPVETLAWQEVYCAAAAGIQTSNYYMPLAQGGFGRRMFIPGNENIFNFRLNGTASVLDGVVKVGHSTVPLRYAKTADNSSHLFPWGFQESAFIDETSSFDYCQFWKETDVRGYFLPDVVASTVNSVDVVEATQTAWDAIKSTAHSVWDTGVLVADDVTESLRGLNTSLLVSADCLSIYATAHSAVLASIDVNIPADADLLEFKLSILDPGNSDQLLVAVGDHVLQKIDLADVQSAGGLKSQLWMKQYAGQSTTVTFYMPSEESSAAEFLISDIQFVDVNLQPVVVAGPDSVVIGSSTATFAVTYADSDDTVLESTIDDNDILVTGPNGFNQYAVRVSVDSSGDGSSLTATYQITAPGEAWTLDDTGTYTATIEADQVSDSNGSFVAAGVLGVFDVTIQPTVTINQAAAQSDPTNGSPINFTVVFNQAVVDFDGSDITLAGSAPGTLVATVTPVGSAGTTYNVAVGGMTGDGTVSVSIDGDKVHNSAGNGNIASTSADNVVLYDATPPTVTDIAPSLDGGVLDAGSNALTITFSEAVIGGDVGSNYTLQSRGADGLLGTADDTMVTLTVSYASGVATLSFPPLTENVYRLTVWDLITDAAGNRLDGDGDGMAGGDWVRDFVAVPHSGVFSSVSTFANGGSEPWAVAVADFNADGNSDLVTANYVSNTVAVMLGDGNGGFASATAFSTGGSDPTAVAVGDFNGDGHADLAVTNAESNNLGVLLGDGNGGFAAATAFSTGGAFPYSVAVGDFDGDGLSDLAAANIDSHTVAVLLGDGEGAFAPAVTFATGGTCPRSVAVADFNGDALSDLAIANGLSCTVGVLLGDGNGGFAPAVAFAAGGWPNGLAIGDFDADGNGDLVVAAGANNTVALLRGDGNGGFAAAVIFAAGGGAPYGVAVGDFNADGYSDLAMPNCGDGTVSVLLGDGEGSFAVAIAFSTGEESPVSLAVCDFDGDGDRDLAVANRDSDSVSVLFAGVCAATTTLTGPNGDVFDIQRGNSGDGQLVQGSSNAFDGLNRLQVDGTDYAPTSYGWSEEDGGRTVVTGDVWTASGLTIHREITVPNTGSEDFVRTVDVFENGYAAWMGGSPITVTVRVVGNLGSDAATTVWGTWDGDADVETTDQWIGTDDADGTGTPAIVHYIHGPQGLRPSAVDVSGDNIVWTYTLTVLPGQTVRLAYFTILGTTRAKAQAAAEVLVIGNGFGGQADAYLTSEEKQSLLNYVPPSVTSTKPELGGGILEAGSEQISIRFNEQVSGGDTVDNFELRSLGTDGLLGTADDTIVAMDVSYASGSTTLTFSPLVESTYRLTVLDGITDPSGNALDGDGDGMAGGDWVREFVVIPSRRVFSSPATLSAGGSGTYCLTNADFNGDGRMDLAVVNRDSNTVAVLLGDGSGAFAAADIFSTGGEGPMSLAVGDFNGDGHPDLVVANRDSNNVAVLLGNGNGAFGTASTFSLSGLAPRCVAVGDFNEDGLSDLAVANSGSDSVDILRGDGSGAFAAPITISSGGTLPRALAIADFNGDEHMDLAVAYSSSDSVGVLLGDGSGVFGAAASYSSGGGWPVSVAVGDFDGNGRPDLVVLNNASGGAGVLLGDGSGGFGSVVTFSVVPPEDYDYEYPEAVVVGDFNGDGKADLVVATYDHESASLLLGDGSGSFASALLYSAGRYPQSLAVGDFDGDGRSDVATADYGTDTIGVLLNIYVAPFAALTTPHGFACEVQSVNGGAGQLIQGANNAFDGVNRLQVGGADYAPTNSDWSWGDGGRTVITSIQTLSGLSVHREITVPDTGGEDLARTMEVFENTTANPISVTVRIVGNLGSDGATTVFATSNGNTSPEASDEWIGTDDADGTGMPAIVHYIHGPAGLRPTAVQVTGDNIEWTYQITVPAGRTVRLACYTILASTRAEAQVAAETLVTATGLGGEAGEFLSTGEMNSLANFQFSNLDADGNGTADALTDGILMLRYLFDPAGAWNYSDALGSSATRTNRTAIKSFLDGGVAGVLDVDGNGSADALTDGILILRYLFDPAGQWNYSDALGSGATRTNRAAIRAFLDQFNPGLNPPSAPGAYALAEDSMGPLDAGEIAEPRDASTTQAVAVATSAAVESVLQSASSISVLVSAEDNQTVENFRMAIGVTDDVLPRTFVAARTQGMQDSSRPSIAIGGAGPDTLFGSDYHGSTNVASIRALDTILQQWNGSSPHAVRVSKLSTWINSSKLGDDSGSVDQIYSEGGLEWFLTCWGDNINDPESGATTTALRRPKTHASFGGAVAPWAKMVSRF
jgi:hypothetical protein